MWGRWSFQLGGAHHSSSAYMKPFDVETVLKLAADSRAVITAENHLMIGGLGDAVCAALAKDGVFRPVQTLGHQGRIPRVRSAGLSGKTQ